MVLMDRYLQLARTREVHAVTAKPGLELSVPDYQFTSTSW
jgi:hypothetical protein